MLFRREFFSQNNRSVTTRHSSRCGYLHNSEHSNLWNHWDWVWLSDIVGWHSTQHLPKSIHCGCLVRLVFVLNLPCLLSSLHSHHQEPIPSFRKIGDYSTDLKQWTCLSYTERGSRLLECSNWWVKLRCVLQSLLQHSDSNSHFYRQCGYWWQTDYTRCHEYPPPNKHKTYCYFFDSDHVSHLRDWSYRYFDFFGVEWVSRLTSRHESSSKDKHSDWVHILLYDHQ